MNADHAHPGPGVERVEQKGDHSAHDLEDRVDAPLLEVLRHILMDSNH
jgi:hypothetical protein